MDHKLTITHVQIRRVQNGFVVEAINQDLWESHRNFMGGSERGPQRTCYIAKDIPELASLLQGFVDMGETGWLASMPLPVITDGRRETRNVPVSEDS